MSLTVALAILGALILAAVVAHGAWSARRANPRQPEGVGAASMRQEPTLAPLPADPSRLDDLRPPPMRKLSARLDPLIDAVAPIILDGPVSGEMALTHLPPSRRAGTKPFLIEGLNADSGDWELAIAGQRYGEFQAGVQMVNRSGALNEIEFSEFVQKIQAFGDGVGGLVEVPDMLDVVGRARELDAFASGHDAQLAVVLRANGAAWSLG